MLFYERWSFKFEFIAGHLVGISKTLTEQKNTRCKRANRNKEYSRNTNPGKSYCGAEKVNAGKVFLGTTPKAS